LCKILFAKWTFFFLISEFKWFLRLLVF
jgi:hypothetical protein